MKFTEQLLAKHRKHFERATQHPLVKQLCAGTLSDKILCIYVSQDLKYFYDCGKAMLKTAYLCPDAKDVVTFNKQLGFFANDEHDYFGETINYCVKHDPSLKKYLKADFILPEVRNYMAYIKRISSRIDDFNYGQMVTFIWANEKIYLQWAQNALNIPDSIPEDLHWRFKQWITLHSGNAFEQWVEFLEGQVNKYGRISEIEPIFLKVTDLEFGFFEGCYTCK
ncbi:hypothetical protein HII12_003047 [Brettanomyces bruxellensis]|uniref:DEBR0S2_20824g1_1 n=2 Tax=Dekkera bruxellensis TaxID=5007 RepID=A0A7D9GZR1_DEKBR|nr:uncharacterized protein BRETT_000213 [Brettanomyces bruxellensis]KAF6010171.1 hypothetical protein HII12_003047 [Brettanomyces bruxellensis]QOU18485.1 hypothetical protein BRETT_000213 [Brettanomyces bruxellensis]VUG17980.1 PET18 [Brettanomyces bruxellensis]